MRILTNSEKEGQRNINLILVDSALSGLHFRPSFLPSFLTMSRCSSPLAQMVVQRLPEEWKREGVYVRE